MGEFGTLFAAGPGSRQLLCWKQAQSFNVLVYAQSCVNPKCDDFYAALIAADMLIITQRYK